MYAIVEIAGQQYKIEKDKKVYVHRLEGKEGDKIDFDRVLLIDNGNTVAVGTPSIEGALVSATILGHLKGDKVIVFKKKRRKGYQKKNGHRQYLTQIMVEDIFEKDAKSSKVTKKEDSPKAEKAEVKEPKKDTAEKSQTAKAESAGNKKPAKKATTGKASTTAKKEESKTKKATPKAKPAATKKSSASAAKPKTAAKKSEK